MTLPMYKRGIDIIKGDINGRVNKSVNKLLYLELKDICEIIISIDFNRCFVGSKFPSHFNHEAFEKVLDIYTMVLIIFI